jgi:peroxiredoxin
MGRLRVGLVALALAAGCASQERVSSLDARLAALEASIQFQARLAKLEETARLQSAALADLGARVPILERRNDALRVELARLERRVAKHEVQEHASMPAGMAPNARQSEAPTRKEAWYASVGGGTWSVWNRALGAELFNLYATGDDKGSILKEKDANGNEWHPRDPGKTGLGADGSADLVDKPLERTRFLAYSGRTVDVSDYKDKKNVVIVILRGFDPEAGVCIACSGQTLALSQNLDEFDKRDAEVFIVYPGKAENAGKFVDAVADLQGTTTPLPLEILLDVDLAVVKEWRIEGRLAKPTTVIVDKKGVVRFAHVGRNKTDRPTVPQLLAVLDKIGK